MPLDSIKKRILAEAEAEVEKIKREASAEAHRILTEAETRAKQIEREAQDGAQAESNRLVKENDAGLEIQTNAIILEAKGSAIERAMESVTAEATALLDSKYLGPMLKSGISQFNDSTSEELVVTTAKKNSKVIESLHLTPKYADVEGFVISSKDNKMKLVISSQSLLESNSDETRKIISDMLFGKGTRKDERTEEEML